MAQEWHIRDYGDHLSVVRVEDGVGSPRHNHLPPTAKAALEYLAVTATNLQAQLDAEIAAHNETRQVLSEKANAVLQKGIALLEHSQKLQDQIAELQAMRGHFPFIVEEQPGA